VPNKSEKLKLAIEPRPSSTWGVTLASLLPRDHWKELRFQVYREANYTCSICGAKHLPIHAHEVWAFDDRKKLQKLADVICVCTMCHNVIHFGRSSQVYPKNYIKELVEHWCKVNRRTKEDFLKYQQDIKRLNIKRANTYYTVKVGRYNLSRLRK
jgi:hypothetical protein